MSDLFGQFLTRLFNSFKEKSVPQGIVNFLVKQTPNPKTIRAPLRSLLHIALTIDEPVQNYLISNKEITLTAGFISSGIHSLNPIKVDTSLNWLGGLIRKLHCAEQYDTLNLILSLIFDRDYRLNMHKNNPEFLLYFIQSNKGEILMEPWMIHEGLSECLLQSIFCLKHIKNDTVIKFISKTLLRYLKMYDDIQQLYVPIQFSTYIKFMSLLSEAKRLQIVDQLNLDADECHQFTNLIQQSLEKWDEIRGTVTPKPALNPNASTNPTPPLVDLALLKEIETRDFTDEHATLTFAKDLVIVFDYLFRSNPQGLPISSEDASRYFKQFIGFLTQKIKNKEIPGVLLRMLIEKFPNPKILNFLPTSLYAVNLCIQAPAQNFLKTQKNIVELSSLLYRYINSKDPLIVDTGLYWLGSIAEKLFDLESDELFHTLLQLVFDQKYRKKLIESNPEYTGITFIRRNPGEVILEPWMISEGLSKYLTHMARIFSKVTGRAARLAILNHFSRYLALYRDIERFPLEGQIKAHYDYCGVISEAKRRYIFDKEQLNPPVVYELLIEDPLKKIFTLFFSNRKEIQSKDILNPIDAPRAIVEIGTVLIDNLAIGSFPSVESHQVMFKKCHQMQMDYHTKLLDLAEEEGDIDFVKSHLEALAKLKKRFHEVKNTFIPFDEIVKLIEARLDSFRT